MISNLLLRSWAILVIASKRLRAQVGLTLATAAGLITLIALVMSIPAYADAVAYRILSANLVAGYPDRVVSDSNRSPFTFIFQFKGPFRGATQWDQAKGVDDYLTNRAGAELGLPLKLQVRYLKTFPFKLYAPADVGVRARQDVFKWSSFFTLSDMQQHIKIIEGAFPAAAPPSANSTVEVLVSDTLANIMGLSVGDIYVAYNADSDAITQIPVKIAGVWRAIDPADPYWFYPPSAMYENLLVPEATYFQRLAPNTPDELGEAVWYLTLDSSSVHSGDVAAFIARITRVDKKARDLMNGMYLQESPKEMLLQYQSTTNLLTFLLTAFSVPIAALILAFISLVGSVIIERQRNEIAVLRSRGATALQIAAITALEGLLLLVVAILAGIPVSKGIIFLMGKTRSFLDFSLPGDLRLDITTMSLVFSAWTAVLVLAARVAPAIAAARHNIITYKQERARNLRPPWWQRAWLDAILFVPAVYGAYLLRKQGSVILPGANVNDPFQNPLLLLVPALGIFAVTLFLLRLLPWMMSAIAWLSARTGSVSLLIASRHLSRTPGFYSAPLMLLILTLSLSAFTASLAQTLDHHFHDQQYYFSGADINLTEYGQCLKFDLFGKCDMSASSDTSPAWSFLPVSAHLKVPGVLAATRVGTWSARASMGGKTQAGKFMGIDRLDFPKVAFWRDDFAPSDLGALLNLLATAPEGVLVPRDFLKQEVLSVGDALPLNVDIGTKSHPVKLIIAGSFDLFPTWYPDTGPLFVGNLDYFFDQVQGQQPYNVWLKTDAQVSCKPLADTLRQQQDLGLDVEGCISARQNINQEQKRPEHQGLFGLLSVGFTGAALLTVLGFLLYALFSFQRRFIEMGIMRAIGLSAPQMTALLAWELVFLIAIGLIAGTGLGVLVSKLFIPYLQLGAQNTAHIPPFIVQIAWGRILEIYALFGLLFVVALAVLSGMLARMKIFQAVKLGETT